MILTLPCHDGLQRLPWHPWVADSEQQMKADHLFKSAGLQLPSFQGISWYHTPWTKTWSLHFPTARSARKSEQKWVPFAAHSFLGRGAMLRPGLRTGSIWYPVVSAAIRCNKNSTLCWEKTGCTVNRGFSVNRLHQQNIWFARFVLFFVIFKAVLLFLFVRLSSLAVGRSILASRASWKGRPWSTQHARRATACNQGLVNGPSQPSCIKSIKSKVFRHVRTC